MKNFLWVMFLFPAAVLAEGLPAVNIEPRWVQCAADTDCAILRDACRSCGEPIALNKQFIQAYITVDYAQRVEANLMMACEACSQLHIKVSCENQICVAKRNTP